MQYGIFKSNPFGKEEVASMFERLKALEERYNELNKLLSDLDVVSDIDKLREYSKEQSDLEDVVMVYRNYNGITSELEDAYIMLDDDLDEEMLEMTKEEINELNGQKEKLEEDLKVLLIPKDPNADKNVIMEIRAAAGGDEAALFAGDLYRMYSRF